MEVQNPPPQSQPIGEDDAFVRRKKTFNLLIAGLVVLLLPLLGIAFIMRKKANDGSTGAMSGMYLFQKRKGAEAIIPVTTAAPNKASMETTSLMMPSQGGPSGSQTMQGGLGFIRGGEDYAEEPEAPPAPAAEPEKKEEKKEEPPPVKDETAALNIAPPPKMVERPKLKFTGRSEAGSFAKPRMADNIQSKVIESQAGATGPGGAAGAGGSSGGGSALGGAMAGGGMPPGGMPPGMPAGGMPDMTQMMKNMPGGGAGGMPDMTQMMKNMPGGGAGMPDITQMMKGMAPGAAPAADTKTKTKTTKKKTTTGL